MDIVKRNRLSYALFAAAAAWAVIAGVRILFTPMGMQSSTSGSNSGGSIITETVTSQVSFYEMQGAWGIAILIIFALLFYSPLHFYNRGRRNIVYLFGIAAIALTAISGFSIGGFYTIGALGLLIGMLLMPRTSQ
jgi:hypothetical protein